MKTAIESILQPLYPKQARAVVSAVGEILTEEQYHEITNDWMLSNGINDLSLDDALADGRIPMELLADAKFLLELFDHI